MTQHPTGDLQALALGELDRATAQAVMEHADACAVCSAELADAMRGVAALAGAPRAGGDTVPDRRRAQRLGWLAGALAAAVLVLGLWNLELQMTAAQVPVAALVQGHFAHHALEGTGGHAKLIEAVDGSWVYVVAVGLEPLRAYQVEVDGVVVGALRAGVSGEATGFWRRPPGSIKDAGLEGPGSSLRWSAR